MSHGLNIRIKPNHRPMHWVDTRSVGPRFSKARLAASEFQSFLCQSEPSVNSMKSIKTVSLKSSRDLLAKLSTLITLLGPVVLKTRNSALFSGFNVAPQRNCRLDTF